MKKTLIIAALLCCVSFFANAQMQTVYIQNNTTADIYLQLYGDVSGNTCSTTYQSGFIAFPPGLTIVDATIIPGLNIGDEISVIEVASDQFGGGAQGCTPYSSFTMSTCSGLGVTTHGYFDFYDGAINGCNNSFSNHFDLMMTSPTIGEFSAL